ncbi:MAG: leucine-rich repeat domain-containing protein, partial [Prevotella sp.]|nr:leucine-rich repeat domain-containing protein [Prevotella sp.]
FEVDGIYYNITDSEKLTVEVTYRGSSDSEYSDEYTGSIILPETVTYNSQIYSVKNIGDYAFRACRNLISITIPNSVTSIGYFAFGDCYNLTSITIPYSVKNIGDDAFFSCDKVTSVHISDIAAWCSIKFGSSFSNPLRHAKHLYIDGKEVTELIIPYGVTSIGDYAFQYLSSLTSAIIPNSVTSIGESAFYACSSLATIAIPNSVTSIGEGAFYGCSKLNSINIPDGITTIDIGTFSYCSSLTSITIPNSVTSIGESAFYACSSLATIAIPNSVTTIDRLAFYGCTSLPVENNVLYADKWAVGVDDNSLSQYTLKDDTKGLSSTFYECSELTSITIPNCVTSIGEAAFAACSSLATIAIPNSVTTIGKDAFSDCSSLATIAIPNSVTTIGNHAFYGCSSLATIAIPNSVTTIGNGTFYGCSSLATISIPNSVTTIENYAFTECCNLASITIPNNVISIGYEAFSDCSSLTSVTIPNSVTSISEGAFYGCDNLSDVYCLSDVPLANCPHLLFPRYTGTLYVPTSSIDAYKSTVPWSYFKTIKELPAHEIVMNNNISTYCYPYDLDFTNVEGLKAFVASSYDDVNEKVQMTRINKVPAGTGIILTGNVGSYNVAYATSKVATDFTNLLKGVTTATIIGPSSDGFLNYILSKGTNGIGFYPAKEGTLAAGKAYLQLPSSVSSAKGISMSFDDETTGIMDNYDVGTMNSDVAVYDLQGRKVKNPTKGLYIVNGKKIMIK